MVSAWTLANFCVVLVSACLILTITFGVINYFRDKRKEELNNDKKFDDMSVDIESSEQDAE